MYTHDFCTGEFSKNNWPEKYDINLYKEFFNGKNGPNLSGLKEKKNF